MGTDVVRILIVDGDLLFAAFATRLFEQAGFSTIAATSGAAAMAVVRDERPGLVLLEVCLPDLNGFEIAHQLRDEYGDDLPIIFVSGQRTDPLDRAAGLLVGGDDYLVKPVDPDELLARTRRLLTRTRRPRALRAGASAGAALTQREAEVLGLLAEGVGSKEIARRLVISPKTVSSHVQRVLAKLGVHTRAEAIAVAYRNGFVAGHSAHPEKPEPTARV